MYQLIKEIKNKGYAFPIKILDKNEANFFYDEYLGLIKKINLNTLKFHQKLMSKQAEIFAKHRLKKIFLSPFSFLVKIDFLREFYYKFFQK